MPDLMSHLLVGLLLAELFNIKKKSIVALGAILPDLLSKLFLINFHFGIPQIISYVPFHTPFMSFLLSILIAPLFAYNRLKIILFFNLGAISHYMADLTMKHFTRVGTRLFFPLSNRNYTLNLIWPEQSVYILIAVLTAYLVVKLFKQHIDKKVEELRR